MQRPVGITVLSILAIISGALVVLGGLLGILGYTTQLLSAVSPWSATKLSGGQIIMASVIVLEAIILAYLFSGNVRQAFGR